MVTIRWCQGPAVSPSFACHDSVFRWRHSVGGGECGRRQLKVSGTPCGSQDMRGRLRSRRSRGMNLLSGVCVGSYRFGTSLHQSAEPETVQSKGTVCSMLCRVARGCTWQTCPVTRLGPATRSAFCRSLGTLPSSDVGRRGGRRLTFWPGRSSQLGEPDSDRNSWRRIEVRWKCVTGGSECGRGTTHSSSEAMGSGAAIAHWRL